MIKTKKLIGLKKGIILILLFQSFTGFGQLLSNTELKGEALEIINPIYAKIISRNDTIIITKDEILNKKEILSSLKLLSVDTIVIDTTIIYKQTSNTRIFSTLPQYGNEKVKYKKILNINGDIREEEIEEQRNLVKKYSEILKFEKWELEYKRDTIIVQTKLEVERVVNMPEQSVWSLDTIWIPEEEQELSFVRPAQYEIAEEMIAVAPKVNRWIRKMPINHKNDCCYWGIDEECMGFWVLEEIPMKVIKIKKAVKSSNTGCGESKPRKIKYKVIPEKVVLLPPTKIIEKFPAVFEQKIERLGPINARVYQKEVLEIRTIEFVYIYEK